MKTIVDRLNRPELKFDDIPAGSFFEYVSLSGKWALGFKGRVHWVAFPTYDLSAPGVKRLNTGCGAPIVLRVFSEMILR